MAGAVGGAGTETGAGATAGAVAGAAAKEGAGTGTAVAGAVVAAEAVAGGVANAEGASMFCATALCADAGAGCEVAVAGAGHGAAATALPVRALAADTADVVRRWACWRRLPGAAGGNGEGGVKLTRSDVLCMALRTLQQVVGNTSL